MPVKIIKYGDPELGVELGIIKGNIELATEITTEAKLLTPVQTGRARNSVMWTAYKTKGGFNDQSGEKAEFEIDAKATKINAFVGTNLDYFKYFEFGTKHQAPQAPLRLAIFLVTGQNLAGVVVEEMAKSLKKGKKVNVIK